MTTAFERATTWRRESETRFSTTIDPLWYQGRGAYGGVLAGGMLRAMMTVVGDARRRPRSLDIHFCAPAREGLLEVDVVLERTGASFATLSARARQADRVVCLATGSFAFDRVGLAQARYSQRPRPEAPPPLDVEPVPVDLPLMPAFTKFFEYRFCVGEPPYSGASTARLGGWIRPREPQPLDAPLAAALIDAYPPALFSRLDEPRGAASVNFTVDFHVELPRPHTDPHAHTLLVATSTEGDGAATDEHAELWTEEGVLLATCRQLIAVM